MCNVKTNFLFDGYAIYRMFNTCMYHPLSVHACAMQNHQLLYLRIMQLVYYIIM